MSPILHLLASAGRVPGEWARALGCAIRGVQIALPTVNPGDDDEEDEDTGNIDPDEDEGLDDEDDDDDEDTLWARPASPRASAMSVPLLRCSKGRILAASHWRHTARPACEVLR